MFALINKGKVEEHKNDQKFIKLQRLAFYTKLDKHIERSVENNNSSNNCERRQQLK